MSLVVIARFNPTNLASACGSKTAATKKLQIGGNNAQGNLACVLSTWQTPRITYGKDGLTPPM
jgi:hypothetical protein